MVNVFMQVVLRVTSQPVSLTLRTKSKLKSPRKAQQVQQRKSSLSSLLWTIPAVQTPRRNLSICFLPSVATWVGARKESAKPHSLASAATLRTASAYLTRQDTTTFKINQRPSAAAAVCETQNLYHKVHLRNRNAMLSRRCSRPLCPLHTFLAVRDLREVL